MKKFFVTIGLLVLLACAMWFWPMPLSLRGEPGSSRQILAQDGRLLATVSADALGTPVRFRDLPKSTISALIDTEDRTFWSNPGVSMRGLVRALLADIRTVSLKQGGSTITQQLVRIAVKPVHRSLWYKMKEMWLALKLTSRVTKESILERYLSSAYYGQRAYGIVDASRTYFDVDHTRLSLSQTALLIGLINAPSNLNPFKNIDGAISRRDLVLRAMFSQGHITQNEFDDAVTEDVILKKGVTKRRAPHATTWILQKHDSVVRTHSTIRTTIDLDLQTDVEDIVTYQLEKLKDKNVTSSAVVVLSAVNGDILAMLGSADFGDDEHDGQVNVALAPRQPGSALKPFTYALALERGMTPATTIADIETQFFTAEGNPYVPRNYDFDHHGLVRLREALANSYNISAVRILEKVGVASLLRFLRAVGISTLTLSPEHYGLALTLGDGEVTLLELASAYGIFPREGITLTPRILVDEPTTEGNRVLSQNTAWLISDILSDDLARLSEFGSSSPLNFDFPVAVKTGTTRNSRDNWTIGYTPSVIVGVWVGNADNSPMKGTSGVTGAGPIFHDVMMATSRYQTNKFFTRPSTIIDRDICKLSGKRPTPLCTETMSEHFVAGTEPQESDDFFQMIVVDNRNNLRAGENCPVEFVERKVFTVFPQELRPWAREKGWNVPPDLYSHLCNSVSESHLKSVETIHIVSPADGSSFLLDPLIPDDSERIQLSGLAPVDIQEGRWFIDGKDVGTAGQPYFLMDWKPTVGHHTIRFRAGSHESSADITVEKDKQ